MTCWYCLKRPADADRLRACITCAAYILVLEMSGRQVYAAQLIQAAMSNAMARLRGGLPQPTARRPERVAA